MYDRLRSIVRGAIIALTIFVWWQTPGEATPISLPSPRPSQSPVAPPTAVSPPWPSGDATVMSAHARRLALAYLRLQLADHRLAELARVRAVLEAHLGVDALISEPSSHPTFSPRPGVSEGGLR